MEKVKHLWNPWFSYYQYNSNIINRNEKMNENSSNVNSNDKMNNINSMKQITYFQVRKTPLLWGIKMIVMAIMSQN